MYVNMATYCVLALLCWLFWLTIASALPQISDKPLHIAAFNIQVFGKAKMSKEPVVEALIEILQRYDLVMIQEIRDSSGEAFIDLKDKLNNVTSQLSPLSTFDSVISSRLGRTRSKEQYGFLFRTDRVKATGVYQFDDVQDDFEREPFAVRFHSNVTELSDFAIIATHVAPSDAVAEIDQLRNVYLNVVDHWKLQAVLLAGDFNADCSYVRPEMWEKISLKTDEDFHWLISDSEDTTTSHTDCSYDRFVTASLDLIDNLVPGSVKVYPFDQDLGLSYEQATAVSDHYPIELKLKGKVNIEFQSEFKSGVSFVVRSNQPVENVNNIRKLYREPVDWIPSQILYTSTGGMATVIASILRVGDVVGELLKFTQLFPDVLSQNLFTLVRAYLEVPVFRKDIFINGLDFATKGIYDIQVSCSLKSPYICEVTVNKYLTSGTMNFTESTL